MTFNEILPIFLNEKGVRRKSWEEDKFIFINGCDAVTECNNNNLDDYIIDGEDLKANDWEIYVEQETEYFDFKTAVKYIEEGKYVSRKAWHHVNIIYLDKTKKTFKEYYGGTWYPDYDDYKAEDWYETLK